AVGADRPLGAPRVGPAPPLAASPRRVGPHRRRTERAVRPGRPARAGLLAAPLVVMLVACTGTGTDGTVLPPPGATSAPAPSTPETGATSTPPAPTPDDASRTSEAPAADPEP